MFNCRDTTVLLFDSLSTSTSIFTECTIGKFSRMPTLEVCVDSFESADAAIRGGAHRLELCSALSEGGLTPTVGLLKTIKKYYPRIPIFAMLRPTNRITYEVTVADMENIISDMQLLYENGVDGYVFGALKRDNLQHASHRAIDIERCNAVIRNSHNLPVTFHRAIDMTDSGEMFNNLNVIERCGFKRVLSSGFAETAEKGINNLIEMQQFAEKRDHSVCMLDRYTIVPGCGITVDNVDGILQKIQWREFHASARVKNVPHIIETYDSVYQRECLRNNPFYVTSEETVRKLVESGKRWDIC